MTCGEPAGIYCAESISLVIVRPLKQKFERFQTPRDADPIIARAKLPAEVSADSTLFSRFGTRGGVGQSQSKKGKSKKSGRRSQLENNDIYGTGRHLLCAQLSDGFLFQIPRLNRSFGYASQTLEDELADSQFVGGQAQAVVSKVVHFKDYAAGKARMNGGRC
jgi:hypothetical protein